MDLIIGAGITGLSYAKYCGHSDYVIIEKNDHIGGYCNTIYQDGFTWDYSGHFFHFRNDDIKRELYKNFRNDEILTLKKKTQILYGVKKIDFPFQQNIHQLPKNEFIDCLYDIYFRENKEYFSSFKEMIFSKFGKSICQKFLVPYNEKLYACELEELDADAMGRFFPYVNIEEIISNFKSKKMSSYNASFTYPKKGAMQYVNAVAESIDISKCFLKEKLDKIDLYKKIAYTAKRKIQYDNLISTIPLPRLFDKCNIDYNKSIYTWNKVLVFNLGFDSLGTDTKNHWLYIPNKEYTFYRVGFYSNIMQQNNMSLYIEIGFSDDEEINVEKERKKVIADLKKAGIVTNQKLISEHSVILDPAYVHINNKMITDKKSKMKFFNDNYIYSIGRYGDWKYCSIEDNILEARELAEKINGR